MSAGQLRRASDQVARYVVAFGQATQRLTGDLFTQGRTQ